MSLRKYFGISPYATWDACVSLSQPWLNATHIGNIVQLSAGDIIFRESEPHSYFYLLRSGFVSSRILRRNGTEILLEIFGPGAIFGEGPAFSSGPRPTTTRAETSVVLSRYEPSEVAEHFKSNPEFATSLLRILGFKNQAVVEKISLMTSRSPVDRVANLMARMARTLQDGNRADADPSVVEISVSHETIAEMTALTRVSVTRALADIEQLGAIPARTKLKLLVDLRILGQIIQKSPF